MGLNGGEIIITKKQSCASGLTEERCLQLEMDSWVARELTDPTGGHMLVVEKSPL